MMTEEQADKAHEALEALAAAIIAAGKQIFLHLDDEQREYVVNKMHDEFRFWRLLHDEFRLWRLLD